MKRIFKRIILVFLYCITGFTFFILPHNYITAQDEEDIEWLDEEDEEVDSLQPDSDAESVQSAEDANKDTSEKSENADSSSDKETTTEDSISDTETVAEEYPSSDTEVVTENPVSDSGVVNDYEQNLYETYVQYYSKRVSMEEWANIIGSKDTYVVQKGDTLWDVSEVLFGDFSYWPKLWSANPSITNPHLIQPNDNLGFIYGTEGTPPSFSVIKEGGLTQNGENKKAPRSTPIPDFLKSKKISVPSSKKLMPIMRSIPGSLPPLYLSDKQETEVSDMDIVFKKMHVPKVSFLNYYMSDKPIFGQGIISSNKDYGSWFHVGQRVILEMQDPVNPGQKLSVIKNRGKLYSSSIGVRGPFGYQVEVQGEVEIIGRVPDSFDLYEAKVTQSLGPVTKGATVLNTNLIQFDYGATDVEGSTEAQIIGVPTYGAHVKDVVSPYSLVYLNRGTGSGMSVGQMYQIKANPSVKRSLKYGYDIKVGEMKVIHTEDRFATGVITEMSNPVHVGDYITSLSAGISTERGYDPLDEDIEDVGGEDAGGFSEESQEPTDELSDEEDVFEAFE